MRLSRAGLTLDLPPGWEGRIRASEVAAHTPMPPEGFEHPVAHLANFALPAEPGDFGGSAVHLMGPGDAFVTLIEHGPESVGTALFSDVGLPRHLTLGDFHPRSLHRILPGQGGYQRFFTEAGRPFCLYVVLGDLRGAQGAVGQVNRALAAITIGARR